MAAPGNGIESGGLRRAFAGLESMGLLRIAEVILVLTAPDAGCARLSLKARTVAVVGGYVAFFAERRRPTIPMIRVSLALFA